jgi:hypothetical protein
MLNGMTQVDHPNGSDRAQSYALYRPPYLGNGRLELFHMLLFLIRIKLKLSIRERRHTGLYTRARS